MMSGEDSQVPIWSYRVNLDKRVRSDHPLRRIRAGTGTLSGLYSRQPSYGKYPGVLAYQFDAYPEITPTGHYWALMFWDSIIITLVFHHSV
jgi:hypothetical protein